jgi:hypothetical protein
MINNRPALLKYRRFIQPSHPDRYIPMPAQGFEMREERLCCSLATCKGYSASRLVICECIGAVAITSVLQDDVLRNPTENELSS